MAGFTTHYIFGIEMFHKCNDKIFKAIIKEHTAAYSLGLQGPDIFFFNIISILEPKQYRYGERIHTSKVNIFFQHAFDFLNGLLNRKNKRLISAYIYGLLAHYFLDVKVHPYVYYKAGFNPEKNNAKETFGLHSLIETMIDSNFLKKKRNLRPSEFYQHKTICLTRSEHKQIKDFLEYCISNTYFPDNANDEIFVQTVSRQISQSIWFTRFGVYILHDNTGIKRKLVQWIEKHFIGFVIISNIIPSNSLKDTMDVMNASHMEWYHPWQPDEKSTKSLKDLYDEAGIFFQNIINEISDKLEGNNNYDSVLYFIHNLSYHSGFDCDKYP